MFALILTVSMLSSVMRIETANAHTPPYYIVSYAYITAAPQPVGIGQQMSVSFWVDYPLPGTTYLLSNVRRTNYMLNITVPDGTTTTQTFSRIDDPTGIKTIIFTPTAVGEYTFDFYYAGQTYTFNSVNTPGLSGQYAAYENDTFSPASTSLTVSVQQEPIQGPISSYPLPTEYWTRPIEGQNTYWYTVASNWLAAPFIIGQPPGTHQPGVVQPVGAAPDSAHIMWTKPIQFGGVVGGNDTAIPGEMYYTGNSYNVRFNNPIIIQGTLFYAEPYGNGGSGGDYVAVDLRTGAEQWRMNTSATGVNLVPSFGYLYDYETPNQYGVLPNGLLIASTSVSGQGTVWRGYDPRNGILTRMNVTNVPGGTNVAGPQGEYLKYILTNYGTSTSPNWYLAQWNSSRVFGGGDPNLTTAPLNWYSGTVNASLPSAYDWNVSVNLGGSPTGWGIGTAGGAGGIIPLVDPGNMVLMIQGTFGTHAGDVATITTSGGINLVFDPANITAINLNPAKAAIGQTLWFKSYPQAPGNVTRTIAHWDPSTGVFIFEDKETVEHWGYSLANGDVLWGPATVPQDFSSAWNYQSLDSDSVAYGNLYFAGGYTGAIYCYDDTTGDLKWTFGNGGPGNTTNAGLTTAFGVYPVWATTIADGKLYLAGDVHSPNSPLWKGQQLYALNATTGEQLWSIFDYANNMYGGITPVADGYLVALNNYDSQLYTYGKGPSAMTVQTPLAAITQGSSIVITGTVTDISAGTKQPEQAARFPNGVPAISDANQSVWMEYVYMQKEPMPKDITGVQVTLSVLDANGNFRQIGTATSDSNGVYNYQWEPDIPGKFIVYASFDGSNSYWPSHAEAAFAVDSSNATPTSTATPTQSAADMYFIPAVAAIMVIIIIGFAILALLMVRKRP